MSSPQIASATKPSLARDWFDALRYWLRGRRGVAVLVVSAVVIGGALNWSWLVAAGIAPLLLTVLPCAVMCALGLCMHKIGGGSCSTEARSVGTPKPDALDARSPEAGEPGPAPLLTDVSARPDQPTAGPAIAVTEPPKPRGRELT